MRRLVVVAALVVGLVAPASAPAAGSGIKGVVLNSTCPGPCVSPSPPPPRYTGGDLTVKLRRLPGGELVGKRHPDDGHFRFKASPGRYRIRAIVRDQNQPSCWEGEAKRVKVIAGVFTRVRLHVSNTCVV
jgi:hypothetical protein